jgi:TusA-related sulfurtransferase
LNGKSNTIVSVPCPEAKMIIDKDVDVVGKACPLPLIALAKTVRTMVKGQTVRISGNDPIFEESIVAFCSEGCHEIVDTKHEGKTVSIVLVV